MAKGFHSILNKFILQAHTEELKVNSFPKTHGDFRLVVSFGKGRKSNVPWISFLGPDISTSNGYYPVFLYYKDLGKLVLSFGISEDNSWLETWPKGVTQDKQRVRDVLGSDNNFRFLDSWVFQFYEVNVRDNQVSYSSKDHDVDNEDLDRHLNEILGIYQSCLPKTEEAIIVGRKPSLKKALNTEPKVLRPSPDIHDLISPEGPNNTVSLDDAIRRYKLLSIKDYQRSYQWTTSQLEELFADLYDAVDSGEPHFFGTLIIQNEDETQNGTVVDGQQRLTSVFILASALRDAVSSLSVQQISPSDFSMPIDVSNIINQFLFSTTKFSDQRFQSNRAIRPILRDSVIAPLSLGGVPRKPIPAESSVVTKSFMKAVQIIRSEVSDDLEYYATDEDKLKRIYLLFRGLSEQFKVLRLVTNDLSESLEIFLTLNNRGLPLGPSDIVRGEIMGVLSKNLSELEADSLQSKILLEWEEIASVVEEPETFLRHYLVATSDEKIQKKKIVTKVTEQFKSKSLSIKEQKSLASQFWAGLQTAAKNYGIAVNPSVKDETGYRLALLEHLSKSHRIMVLGILGASIPQDVQEELIRLTFVLSFRWVMANQNAQKLEDFYQKRCQDLRDGASPERVIQVFKTVARDINVKPSEYFSLEGDSSAITRVLLHAIHVKLHPRQEVTSLDNKKFHLEHIAPKTPTDHWKKKLIGTSSSNKLYDQLVQQGGNLLLLDQGINIEAQQKPFVQKRDDHYKSATFYAHTNDMNQLVDWDAELINERTRWMAAMFGIIWSVETIADKVISFQDWLSRLPKAD